jgi:hypothetical protein
MLNKILNLRLKIDLDPLKAFRDNMQYPRLLIKSNFRQGLSLQQLITAVLKEVS